MTPPCATIEWKADGTRDYSTKLGQSRNSTSVMTVPAALREWRTSLTIHTTMLGRLSGSLTVPMPTANRFASPSFLPDVSATPSTPRLCQVDR